MKPKFSIVGAVPKPKKKKKKKSIQIFSSEECLKNAHKQMAKAKKGFNYNDALEAQDRAIIAQSWMFLHVIMKIDEAKIDVEAASVSEILKAIVNGQGFVPQTKVEENK